MPAGVLMSLLGTMIDLCTVHYIGSSVAFGTMTPLHKAQAGEYGKCLLQVRAVPIQPDMETALGHSADRNYVSSLALLCFLGRKLSRYTNIDLFVCIFHPQQRGEHFEFIFLWNLALYISPFEGIRPYLLLIKHSLYPIETQIKRIVEFLPISLLQAVFCSAHVQLCRWG